ncbi:MAG: c-type cytochrome [Gammaproteobacteria bacterium]
MFEYFNKYALILGIMLLLSATCLASQDIPREIEATVKQCAMCHGTDGNSTINTIPSFAGTNENYFKYAMQGYQNGNRSSEVMKTFADQLTSQQVDKLATYYSRQTFVFNDQPYDKDLAAKGKALHNQYCRKCHGDKGIVDPYYYGILGGQWAPYLRKVIKLYIDGSRKTNPIMIAKFKHVQEQAGEMGFEQLVNYYASVRK